MSVHKEPKKNKDIRKREYAPKPPGYGTTKYNLKDYFHSKKDPIELGVKFRGMTGNMNGAGTAFYSDEATLEWWKEELNPGGEWKLYDIRYDVTGACEMTTREILDNHEVPWSYKSLLMLQGAGALGNRKAWIPDSYECALISSKGWVVVITPIKCTDFDRLDAVKEDLRMENRSAVHVRRRTVLLEEANDFGGWFS